MSRLRKFNASSWFLLDRKSARCSSGVLRQSGSVSRWLAGDLCNWKGLNESCLQFLPSGLTAEQCWGMCSVHRWRLRCASHVGLGCLAWDCDFTHLAGTLGQDKWLLSQCPVECRIVSESIDHMCSAFRCVGANAKYQLDGPIFEFSPVLPNPFS